MAWDSYVVLSTTRTHKFSDMVISLVNSGASFDRDMISDTVFFDSEVVFDAGVGEPIRYMDVESFDDGDIPKFIRFLDETVEKRQKIGVYLNSKSIALVLSYMVDHYEIDIRDAPYVNNAPYDEKHLKIIDCTIITNEILMPLLVAGFAFESYDFINRDI